MLKDVQQVWQLRQTEWCGVVDEGQAGRGWAGSAVQGSAVQGDTWEARGGAGEAGDAE